LKDTHEFIGWVGLSLADFAAQFTPAVEIGWRIGSQYWNNGYATEAALVVRDYAFDTLRLEELVSFTVPANIRSIKLMERLGFTNNPVDDFNHPAFTYEHPLCRHVLYKLKKDKQNV
jgi:RimJ/RimL family protein N-acetyltransferase